jgi:hypothetical protein
MEGVLTSLRRLLAGNQGQRVLTGCFATYLRGAEVGGTPAGLLGAWRVRRSQNYFIAPLGMGMSELKMSHWVTHFPSTFLEASIHLPWSRWEPSAPVITYVPVP